MLSYLRRLPVDVVKIDRAFITDLRSGAEARAIVAAVTNMAHQLGFSVVAEGVETRAERDHVADIGCEYSQGYHFAAAMRAATLGEQLRTHAPHPLYLPAGV